MKTRSKTFVRLACVTVIAATVGACASIQAGESLDRYLDQDFVRALEYSQQALSRDPQNKDALATAGWSTFQLGRYKASRNYFRELLEADPNEFEGLLGMGWTELKLANVEVAEGYFLQAKENIQFSWQDNFVYDGLGWVEITRGNLDHARKMFIEESKQLEYVNETADPQVGLGWVALLSKDYDAARANFYNGLSAVDKCFNCLDGLARVAFERGDYQKALEHAVAGTRRVRHSMNLVALLDAILKKIGNTDKSIAVYESLVAQYPNAAFYHTALGAAYLDGRRFADAEKSLLRALQLNPRFPDAEHTLQRLKRAKATDQNLGLGTVVDPQSVALRKARSWILRAGTQSTSAANTLGAAVEPALYRAPIAGADVDPRYFSHAIETEEQRRRMVPQKVSMDLYRQGWAMIDAGRLDDAARAFQTAAVQAPKGLRYLMVDALGWVAYYRRDYAQAERIFNKVLKERPGSYLSQKGLGFIAMERRHYEQATKLVLDSLALNPYQVPLSYIIPAQQLIDAGRYEEARRILVVGEWAHSRNSEIVFLHALALDGVDQDRRAAEKAEIAASLSPIEIDPKFDELKIRKADLTPALRTLAWGLFLAGEYQAAHSRFDQIAKLPGSNPDAIRGRGFASFRLGKFKAAIEDLASVVKYEPDQLPELTQELSIPGTGKRAVVTYNARSTMAWAYLRLDQPKRAASEFRKVLKDHPFWVDALSGLAYSLLEQNDPDGAARNFRAALRISPLYPDARQGLVAAKSASSGKQRPPRRKTRTGPRSGG